MISGCDLIRTIEEGEIVPDYSESSDEEDDVSLINSTYISINKIIC